MMTPAIATKYVFTITALVDAVTLAGDVGYGVRRIIPITGGEVRGEAVNGKVLSLGADFQFVRPNALDTGETGADLEAVVVPGLTGVFAPKVGSAIKVPAVWVFRLEKWLSTPRWEGFIRSIVFLSCSMWGRITKTG